jgi:hypothetical protein
MKLRRLISIGFKTAWTQVVKCPSRWGVSPTSRSTSGTERGTSRRQRVKNSDCTGSTSNVWHWPLAPLAALQAVTVAASRGTRDHHSGRGLKRSPPRRVPQGDECLQLARSDRYCDATICRLMGQERTWLTHARYDAIDPYRPFAAGLRCNAQHDNRLFASR